MWSLLRGGRCCRHHVSSTSIFASQRPFYYSSATTSGGHTHFMVDYLINSLGFSTNEAVSTSSKVTHLKSAHNPHLVIDLFRRYGFDDTHIKSVVCSMPEVLLHKPDKTLEPRLKVIRELGLTGPDLAEFVWKDPWVFQAGLDTHIEPMIRYLRELLGCDEKVVKAITGSTWLLSCNHSAERVPRNVRLFLDCGLPNDKIQKYLIQYPRLFTFRPEHLQDTISRVEDELHIPLGSGMFFQGVCVLCYLTKPKLEMKFGIFRSYLWPDPDIHKIARSQPRCIGLSEANLRSALDFYMKDLCFTSTYLATRPMHLMMSLEKRVKPRVKVLKILEGSKLVNFKSNLATVLNYTETKFVEKYILRYKKEVPDLLENYSEILKH